MAQRGGITAFCFRSSYVSEFNLLNDLFHGYMFLYYLDDLLSLCHGVHCNGQYFWYHQNICRFLETNTRITSTL
jgi:hypothetical protein